ncbi:hypothetical protein OIY81_1188 [Cryptosporidium canis]|nr:hypothetical protein OIY81_1188 [Cryptosporidium canis]
MSSDSEESWHSILEPESLEDVFRKRIIEFDPVLGLGVSREIRGRSLELIDTLILPLCKVEKGDISLCSFPKLSVGSMNNIGRLVVTYSCPVEQLGQVLDEVESSVSLLKVSELHVVKSSLAGGFEEELGGDDESMLRDIVSHMRGPIRVLKLRNMELSMVGFLRLLQSEEFSELERLELEDCELEGIRRARVGDRGKWRVSVDSVREVALIRTDPAIARFCPNLKRVTLETTIPLEDGVYDLFRGYNNLEGDSGIEFLELRVPSGEVSDSQFLESFFVRGFPELEHLRELRIAGSKKCRPDLRRRGRYDVVRQLDEPRVLNRGEGAFPRLQRLELRDLYISLDTFDYLLLVFSLTGTVGPGYNFQEDGIFKENQKVSACYNLRFEDGSSRNHKYNISRYQGMSIQEESDFMLNSDYAKLGFSPPDDNALKSGLDGAPSPICAGSKDHRSYQGCGWGSFQTQSGDYSPRGTQGAGSQNLQPSQRDSQVMQPFLDIKSWEIRLSRGGEASRAGSEERICFSDYGVLVLDNQIQEMRYQSATEVHRNLISKTILEYLVDPLKTRLSISSSRVILSLGFDNLIYSGYMLGVLSECQHTVQELSALSFLIPIQFFCQLELDRIQVLNVSLFKNRNLEPADLIKLCAWIERYGRRLRQIHIRVTGASSKWVPKETEIKRLVHVWKKMCPEARKRDQVKFECCFTDHIFSKMDRLSADFELGTDSD